MSYAIIRLFTDEVPRCAVDVINELDPLYSGHKMLTEKGVDEALATAKENGLLDETGAKVDDGVLHVHFMLSDYGREMVERYL